MVGMKDLFPPGEAVRKELLRRHLVGPVANVQGFGAKGDGIADDTPAIQAAIDSVVVQGGGTVYLPAGTYKIMPQRVPLRTDVNALRIAGDNVRLTGEGPALTRLVFRVAGDRNPSDSFDIVYRSGRPSVWRGSAIAIENASGQPRHGIVIEGLEIDGGAYPGNTDDQGPARPETGGGWDVTHKAIYIAPDHAYTGLRFADLHLHNFRGEIIYGGSAQIDDVVVERCHIHSTNADGIAVSAGLIVRDSRIDDCAHACCENFHGANEARYLNNVFAGSRIGVSLQTRWDSPHAALISGNVFEECRDRGLQMTVENGPILVSDNTFVDCGYSGEGGAAIVLSPANGEKASIGTGIVIKSNAILRQNRDGGYGVRIACENGGKLRSVVVSENFIGSSGTAVEKNLRFAAPIAYAFTGKVEADGVVISRNTYFRPQRGVDNTSAAGKAAAPMPLMSGNETIGASEVVAIVTDGTMPIRLRNEGPTPIGAGVDGIVTPVLVPADYARGQRLILTCAAAGKRVYFPQSSDLYECREGRFLSPEVFLTLECDGKKFREVAFEDRRLRHYAEVTDGSVIDADGFPTVYISVPSERRFTAFDGIGHGSEVRIVAVTNNVTIVNNDAIQLQSGTDYQMVANEVKTFFRTRDGVLREV